jgi:hypothetical protein
VTELIGFQATPSLMQLKIFKNLIQSKPQYSLMAFEWIPQLVLLDNLYQDGSEIMLDDEQRGQETVPEPQQPERDRKGRGMASNPYLRN